MSAYGGCPPPSPADEPCPLALGLFDALIRGAMDWALVLDADSVFRYVSPSRSNTFGFTSDEVLGLSGWEFVHPDDRPHVQAAFERVVESGGATEVLLFRVINSSGEWLWVEEVFTNLLDDPNVSGIVCNGRHVSERVRAEQALNESEAKYRAIAETSQEGIWVVTLSGHTVYANQRMAELLETNLKAMYAKPGALLVRAGNSRIRRGSIAAAPPSARKNTNSSTRILTARRGSFTSR